jgi:hypothetical protein
MRERIEDTIRREVNGEDLGSKKLNVPEGWMWIRIGEFGDSKRFINYGQVAAWAYAFHIEVIWKQTLKSWNSGFASRCFQHRNCISLYWGGTDGSIYKVFDEDDLLAVNVELAALHDTTYSPPIKPPDDDQGPVLFNKKRLFPDNR